MQGCSFVGLTSTGGANVNDSHLQAGAMKKIFSWFVVLLMAGAVTPALASTGTDGPCRRPAAGTAVGEPANLYSRNGLLKVHFDYFTSVDRSGRTLFCFVTADGVESPTLHLHPGDTLELTVTNQNPTPPPGSPTEVISNASDRCGAVRMTITSVNVHFHGTNTAPICHADGVIHTLINSGQTFRYAVKFPADEPPGLYWYHPHVHGIAEAAVQGGASGAIVVDGVQNIQPAVAGLPARVLLIRDQTIPHGPTPGGRVPSWDLSLNYVPISYPKNIPAVIGMQPGGREFWRVANAAADTIIDLQLLYDGVVQPVQVVALDGVPLDSQDGRRRGELVTMTHILLPPAARAEFIVTGPTTRVKEAIFRTLKIDTGPDGDNDTTRTLADIVTTSPPPVLPVIRAAGEAPAPLPLEPLAAARVTAKRTLYFSEVLQDPTNPAGPTNFFITVVGAVPKLFSPDNQPAITTRQGAVEDWTIENRALENHEFHMHQIHFLLLERDGVPVPPAERQFLDTIQVPYWTGKGPFPSVTVRMDFRGKDVGDFVYHCHILGHEDAGMMAIIRVLPAS
jgi:FtsP/CotA-like multicopper oxidase with cupredoxin domain